MDRKNLQDKLDLLSKQMKQIQNEMYSLQEQEDSSNNLVNTPDIPASTSHQSSPQILSVDPLSTPTTTRQQSPIPKPLGNYVNIPKTLKLSKITLNDYQNHIRDLVKLHVDLKKEYKNQNLKTIDLVVSKFKKRNMTFPDTINDWAIKMMIKRSINNIRDYYRRKGHDNKKSKNKESADDNNNTNIDQNNGSSDEINETSSDKYKESTRQIDKSDEIADKSDNGKESTEIGGFYDKFNIEIFESIKVKDFFL
ncbi:unnamed protein product [Rhizophagus irregularis]|nr:unnamed protein product [Rhizophagus irregularis]